MDTNDDLRVKYYSTNDLSAGFYLKRIEDIIFNFIIEFILYIGQNSS